MHLRLFLLTFVTFLVQISLTRLFGYILAQNFTPICISLALFGLGTGAFLRLRFYQKTKSHKVYTLGFAVMGISLLLVHLSFLVFPHILGTVFWSLLFFVASGALISQIYEEFSATKSYLAYSLDMAGGALACTTAVPLLNFSGPIAIMIGAGAVCVILSALSWRGKSSRQIQLAGTLLALSMAGLSAGIHLRFVDEFPDRTSFAHAKALTERASKEPGGRIVDFEWSSVGRADLYENPAFDGNKWIYYDQINPSTMLGKMKQKSQQEFLKSRFASLPLNLFKPKNVLVVGSGGGYEVELAQLAGVETIDAVELNPAIVRLVERWRPFTGLRFERDNVTLIVSEGRTFLMRTDKRYDLIQMALVLTGAADSATHASLENYLYTKESFRTIMGRLSDRGCLAIIDDSLLRTVRQFMTAMAVLRESGMEYHQAMKQILVFYNSEPGATGYRHLVLIFPNAIDDAVLSRAEAEARLRGFQPLWVSNIAAEKPFSDIADKGTEQFMAQEEYDVSPVSDDRPYFFNFKKGLWDKLKLTWPFLALAGFATLLAFLIRRGKRKINDGGRTHLTAFLIGLGFIFVELGLIQKLTIAIGSPTKILSVLLFSILLWCGIGSQISSIIGRFSERRISIFCWAVAAIIGGGVYWIHDHYLMAGISSDSLRILSVILVLAPLGIAMGMPFPSLLNSVRTGEKGELAAIWGINGLASLAGANLWVVVSQMAGGTVSLLCGSALYIFAGISAWNFSAK